MWARRPFVLPLDSTRSFWERMHRYFYFLSYRSFFPRFFCFTSCSAFIARLNGWLNVWHMVRLNGMGASGAGKWGQVKVKCRPLDVSFGGKQEQDECIVSVNMDGRTILLYNLHDQENALELAFQVHTHIYMYEKRLSL